MTSIWAPDAVAVAQLAGSVVTLHGLSKEETVTYAAVVSGIRPSGRELLSLRFVAPSELPHRPPYPGGGMRDLSHSWADAEIAKCSQRGPLIARDIAFVLPPNLSRDLLTAHLMAAYREGIPWDPLDRHSLVRKTARVYEEFTRFGETAAATRIAALMNVSAMTIRNRLSEARQKGWLASPGHGVRRG